MERLYISAPTKLARGHKKLITTVANNLGSSVQVELTQGQAIVISDTCTAYVISPSTALRKKLLQKLGARGPTIYNEASFALLFVWRRGSKHRTMLFTSDCPGTHIVEGLRALFGDPDHELRASGVLEVADDGAYIVDYMDLPHHGSKKDSKVALFKAVRARTYGWSSDGGFKYRTTMADAEVMKHIVAAHKAHGPHADVYFTFPKWARERVAGSEDLSVVNEHYAEVGGKLTWVLP